MFLVNNIKQIIKITQISLKFNLGYQELAHQPQKAMKYSNNNNIKLSQRNQIVLKIEASLFNTKIIKS